MTGRELKNSLTAKGQVKRREKATVKLKVGDQEYNADFFRYRDNEGSNELIIVAFEPPKKEKMLGLKTKRRKNGFDGTET